MGIKRRHDQEDGPGRSTAETLPRKKLSSATEVDHDLARLFNDLADEVRATRLRAAKDIVALVSGAETEKCDKITTRLIKGLCSSRKAARLGFIVTLTEVFAQRCIPKSGSGIPSLAVVDVPAIIETLTAVPDAGTNQERKDYQLGRCLACRAFIESGVLFSPKLAQTERQLALQNVLKQLMLLYKSVPALRWEAGSAANQILSRALTDNTEYVTSLIEAYASISALKSAEGLAAWLHIRDKAPHLVLPEGIWQNCDPLSTGERRSLVHILRDSHGGDDGTILNAKNQSGQASPAWPYVLRAATQRFAAEDSGLVRFWKDLVDDSYFSAKSSIERKAIGLQIFNLALHELRPEQVQSTFSPNLVRCIINQRSSPKNNLYTNAEAAFTISQGYKQGDTPALASLHGHLAQALIRTLGLPNFDKLTRTKTLENSLQKTSRRDLNEAVLRVIDGAIKAPQTSDHLDVDASRRASVDLLQLIFKQQVSIEHKRLENTEDVRTKGTSDRLVDLWRHIIDLFVSHGYISPMQPQAVKLSAQVQEYFRTRMMSCSTYLLDPTLEDDFNTIEYIVRTIEAKSSSIEYNLALEADGKVHQTLKESQKYLDLISKKLNKTAADKSRHGLLAFRLLFSLAIIQVYNGDADAVMILEELQECWKGWRAGESMSPLVEILLGFLSRPSALFRKLAEQVFTALAPNIDADALDSLLSVLEKSENVSGQKELFEDADDVDAELEGSGSEATSDEDDVDSSASDDTSDDSEASDVEVIEVNGRSNSESEDSSAEEDDGDDAISDDGGDDDDDESVSSASPEEDAELTAFEAKLAQMLQTQKPKANGAVDKDEDDASTSDESDMDDDEMMALDGHLSTIFAERSKQTKKKADPKAAKETVVNFKNRVLDLLAIFAKQCSSRPPVLSIIAPLLALTRTTSTKAVAERSAAVLRALFDTCARNKRWPAAETTDLLAALDGVHDELRRSTSKAHAAVASRAGLFLVRALLEIDRALYDEVLGRYAALQGEWFADGKSKIPGSVFTEFTSWSLNSRKAA